MANESARAILLAGLVFFSVFATGTVGAIGGADADTGGAQSLSAATGDTAPQTGTQQLTSTSNLATATGPVVNGTVRDHANDTVSGMEVVYHNDPVGNASVTDGSGEYSLLLNGSDRYHVDLTQTGSDSVATFPDDGVPDMYAYGFVDVSGNTTEDIDLPYGYDLNITVRDESGQVIPNASVDVAHINDERSTGVSGDTNTNGVFVPHGADSPGIEVAGEIHVHADASGYASNTVRLSNVDTNGSVDVTLLDGGTIAGTINGTDGQPAAEDMLRFESLSDDKGENTTWTNSSGAFSAVVAEGVEYNAQFVQTAGQNQYDASFPTDGIPDVYSLGLVNSSTNLDNAALPEAHNLTIDVVDENGNPVSDVPVHITHHRSNELYAGASTTTGGNGNVSVEATGRIHIDADPVDGSLGEASTDVTLTDDRTVELVLPEVVNVTGQLVSWDGDPQAGYQAGFVSETFSDYPQLNDTGNLSTQLAVNNTYETEFRQRNYDGTVPSYPKDGVPDLFAGQTVEVGAQDVDLGPDGLPQAHRLNVTVVDEQGDPVSGVPIYVGHHSNESDVFVPATTTDNGQLILEDASEVGVEANTSVLEGSLSLSVQPRDAGLPYAQHYEDGINFTDDDTLTIELGGTVDVTGSVEYADGTVPAGYRVNAFGETGSNAPVAEDGSFTLETVPDRSYDLAFKQTDWDGGQADFPKDGWPDVYAFEEFSVGDSPMNVGTKTLPPAHQLNVTVVNESGVELSGMEIDVLPSNGDATGHHPATTTENGEVMLEGSSSPGIEVNGTVEIGVESTDQYARTEKTWNVTSDTNGTITVQEKVTLTGQVVGPNGENPNGTIIVRSPGENQTTDVWKFVTPNETGHFSTQIPAYENYSIGFGQDNPSNPPDGITDFYELYSATITDDVDIGNHTIPVGHQVDFQVVDQHENPVDGASVLIGTNQKGGVDGFGWVNETYADGRLYPTLNASEFTGHELNGEYDLYVVPPELPWFNSTRQHVRNITVTSNGTETIEVHRNTTVTNIINGTVTGSDGEAVPGELIVVANASGDDALTTWTNGSGVFHTSVPSDLDVVVGMVQVPQLGSTNSSLERDGIPDVYALGNQSTASSVTIDETLPEPSVVNVTIVGPNGKPVPDADVGVLHETSDGVMEARLPLTENGTVGSGETLGVELHGEVTLFAQSPTDTAWTDNKTSLNVTGPENVTLQLHDEYEVTGTWTYPNGTNVSNVDWSLTNFNEIYQNGVTDGSGSFATTVPVGANKSYSAYVHPLNTGDGVVDVWNVVRNVTSDVSIEEQLPKGYTVNLSASTVTGETADTQINVEKSDGPAGAGWIYEYGTGRNLDSATALNLTGVERPWHHVQARDLANGTYNVTVLDSWTHDVLHETTITVDGPTSDRNFTVDRYPSVNQSEVEPGTVARDIEAPGLRSDTTESLLNNGFNVRLTIFGADDTTDVNITEELPAGYSLNDSYGLDDSPSWITYDGSGTVNVSYTYDEEGRDTLELNVTGNVSDIRYRVDALAPSHLAVFEGVADGSPILGETHLGDEYLITGSFDYPTGATVEDNTVFVANEEGYEHFALTNETGAFTARGPVGTTVGLIHLQGNWTAPPVELPNRDGAADIYPVEEFTRDTDYDVGTIDVPVGHVLNVTVENESGDPVPNAFVELSNITHDGMTIETGPDPFPVGQDGMMRPYLAEELAIDLSTIEPGIELNGSVTLTVYAPENVTNGEPSDYTVRDTRNVSVSGPMSETVTVNTSSTDDGTDDGDTGDSDGTISVVDASLSESTITAGDSVTVNATVNNTKGTDTEITVELFDGTVVIANETVMVDGNSETQVSFTETVNDAGTYDLSVNGESAGTLEVQSDTDDGDGGDGTTDPPSVVNASLDVTTVTEGKSVLVNYTVENPTDSEQEVLVNLSDGDSIVAQKTVVVSASGTNSTFFEYTPQDPGEYTISVNDETAGTLTVEEQEETDSGVPGFGMGAALVAVLIATIGSLRLRSA